MKNSINNTKITAIIVTLILITSTMLLTTNNLAFAQGVEEGGSYRLPSGVTADYEVVLIILRIEVQAASTLRLRRGVPHLRLVHVIPLAGLGDMVLGLES